MTTSLTRIRRRAAVLAALAASLAVPVHAQDARVRGIDSIFAVFAVAGSPGCALGVVQNGELIYRRGYGLANLDYRQPLDGKSVFYLASVSKQFTAAAVAIAATQGRLSLDDDVRKYIPELPDYGTPITIRHLIHHTSGIRDYLTLIPFSGRRADDYWSDAALLALITRQRALNFTPGSEHLYSNTGYVLLAEIIKRATGQSLRRFAEDNIFFPLGMGDTHFHDDAGEVVPGRVIGYTNAPGGWRINHWFSFDKVGDGGLYSSVEDLARWDGNFYSGAVGGEPLLRLLHQRGRLNSGDSIAYAFGLTHNQYRGLRTVEHGGSLAGFRTVLLRFPEQRFSSIVLCNTPTANPAQLARRVADLYLNDRMQPLPPPRAVTRADVTGGPVNTAAAQQAQAGAPPRAPVRLDEYVGSFRSDELDVVYRFAAESDTLVLYRGERRIPLQRGADEMFTTMSFVLRFTRAGGSVSGLTLDAGRVRGIRFVRITDAR